MNFATLRALEFLWQNMGGLATNHKDTKVHQALTMLKHSDLSHSFEKQA